MDLVTKDQRKFKFRFETLITYQRANDAMQRHVEISKIRDLFTYDFSKKIKDDMLAMIANSPPNTPIPNQLMNDNQVLNIVMKEFDRMGVPGA